MAKRYEAAPAPFTGDDGITVVGMDVESDEIVGREGGFFGIHRLHLRNVRADGSRSAPILCDFMERPKGLDAVAVAIWAQPATPGGDYRVLVREGMRPTILFGRPLAKQIVPDPAPRLFVAEIVAGIVEVDDQGEAGLLRRAALEVEEEAGYRVAPERIQLLGAGALLSPGALAERCFFAAVEVDPAARGPIVGDGSAMEEGARSRWYGLDEVIAGSVAGRFDDAKTELGLRRLRDYLVPATLLAGEIPGER